MHVHLDDAQYIKNQFFSRNRVVDRSGREVILAVPVSAKVHDTFLTTTVVEGSWRRSHATTLRQVYGRFPAASTNLDELCLLYERPYASLAELNITFIAWLLAKLGIDTPVRRSSELGIGGKATERLLAICHHLGGTEYYSPAGARVYIDAASFAQEAIDLTFQEYTPAEYPQRPGAPFVPFLSVVDPLLRFGGEEARRIVLAGAAARSGS